MREKPAATPAFLLADGWPMLSSPPKRGPLRRNSRSMGGLLSVPLPCQRRQRAAFAVAGILVVDPVVRIDPLEGNVVTRPQHLHPEPPCYNLSLGSPARHVGIIAGELHPDRIAADHLTISRT